MTDTQRLLADTAEGLFSDHASVASEESAMDEALWQRLEDSDLTRISVAERLGGSGGSLSDAAVILSAAADACARVPVAETALEAGWLLAEADLALPAGPLTAAYVDSGFRRSATVLDAPLQRVPWGSAAQHVVIVAELDRTDVVTYLPTKSAVITPGTNIAGEPRDRMLFAGEIPPELVREVPRGTAQLLQWRQALTRSVMLAAAARRALRVTLRYASEREQFGRPIAKFQAVQHLIAEMAGEVAVMSSASATAVATCESRGMSARQTRFAIAAAKAQCSQSATTVARIAHQVHGAIGFTHESSLRHATTRLWAWRDEAGNEQHWFAAANKELRTSGLDAWHLITE